MASTSPVIAAAAALLGASLLVFRDSRRRAEQAADAASQRATRKSASARRSILRMRKPSRHKLLTGKEGGVDPEWLRDLFPSLEEAFDPQGGVTYKGVDWKISSYMELISS